MLKNGIAWFLLDNADNPTELITDNFYYCYIAGIRAPNIYFAYKFSVIKIKNIFLDSLEYNMSA